MQQTLRYRSAIPARPAAAAPRRVASRGWLGLPVSLALLLVLWQGVVIAGDYPAFTLPAPLVVWERFVAAAAEGTIWVHMRATLLVALSGFALALGLALVLGYLLSRSAWIERLITPQLAMAQAVPVVAVAPLIILWAGNGVQARILVAAVVVFFPMLINTVVALRSVPRELREMALISGAGRGQMLRHVELPLALPVLFGGVKAGLALATTGAVVGEFVAGRSGLGALINIARGLFDTPLIFVALAMLVIITLVLYLAADLAERLLVRWEAI